MKYLITLSFFISTIVYAQYPILKDGLWGVINEQGSVVVSPRYQSLSVFKYGLSVAKPRGEKFGVVNMNNEVVLPMIYDKIEILGADVLRLFLGTKESIYQISTKKILFEDVQNVSAFGEDWCVFKHKEKPILFNTSSLNFTTLEVEPIVEGIQDEFVVFQHESKEYKVFYDRYMNKFVEKNLNIRSLQAHNLDLLITPENSFYKVKGDSIWKGIKDYLVRQDALILVFEDSIEIWQDERVVRSVQGDEISFLNPELYKVGYKKRYGVVDQFLNPVLTSKFDDVVLSSNPNYFLAINQKKSRLFTRSGKDVLGKSFTSFRIDLPIIKAYDNGGMTQYFLENGKVVASKEFANVVSVYGTGRNQESNNNNQLGDTSRIPDLWFPDTLFKPLAESLRTAKDSMYVADVKWGVKLGDSITASPVFSRPRALDSTPFSLSSNRDVLLLLNANPYQTTSFPSQTTSVFRNRGEFFVRVFAFEDYSIIRTDNSREYFSIFQSGAEFNLGCKLTNSQGVLLSRTNDRFGNRYYWGYKGYFEYELRKLKQDIAFMERRSNVVLDRDFNYYNSQGYPIFDEAFTNAFTFKKGTAIVARKGKYGIIKGDSIITPLQYSNIARCGKFGDTLFKVYDYKKESLVYDSSLNKLPYSNYLPSKYTDDFLLLTHGRQKLLINQAGQTLYEGTKYLKFTPFNTYYYRHRRLMQLYGESGNEIAIEMPEPEAWLTEDLYLAKKGSRMAVVTVGGDTLTPFDVRSFSVNEHYILLETSLQQELYDLSFNFIKEIPLQKRVQLDALGKGYTVQKGKKTQHFTGADPKQKERYKGYKLKLSGGLVFIWEEDSVAIYKSGEKMASVAGFDFIREEADGTRLLMNRAMEECLFMVTPEDELIPIEENYSCKYLGNGYLKIRVRRQAYKVNIYNPLTDVSLLCDEVEGVFGKEGYLLIEKDSRCYFIDTLLRKQFYYSFDNAKPFINGFAAVEFLGGWTLIDVHGDFKSYPGHRELSNCGGKYFQVKESAKVGLVDANGKEVIPPIYDFITKVSNDVVQVIQEGKVGYFRINGDVIYLPAK